MFNKCFIFFFWRNSLLVYSGYFHMWIYLWPLHAVSSSHCEHLIILRIQFIFCYNHLFLVIVLFHRDCLLLVVFYACLLSPTTSYEHQYYYICPQRIAANAKIHSLQLERWTHIRSFPRVWKSNVIFGYILRVIPILQYGRVMWTWSFLYYIQGWSLFCRFLIYAWSLIVRDWQKK